MPDAFFIKNHSSHDLTKISVQELGSLPPHPPFDDKSKFLKWCHDPATDHCFFSLAEPRNPSRRANNKDNPVVALHGLVADYEGLMNAELLATAISKCSKTFPINFTTKTFSGGARVLWLFERPLYVINRDLARAFLAIVMKEMKLVRLLPGLDEPAFIEPAQPYELGTQFTVVNEHARISPAQTSKWLFDAAKRLNWKQDGGAEIAIEDVAAEVERRWPGRWTGSFSVGALGVRFWESGADNSTGAWIREHGVVAFSGENRFMPWAEILGTEFVKKYETDRIGGAISDVYYDGKGYWYKGGENSWYPNDEGALRRHLRLNGLKSEARKGSMSEVDQAIAQIERNSRVDGGFPFLFDDHDIVRQDSRKYLNISRVKAMPPADGPRAWGEQFPWLAKYIAGLFPGEQRDAFLSWHFHFWSNAWRSRRTKGHALFIAGPGGAGKTLFSWRVVGDSVGGFADASAYLMGDTQFNAPLFEVPLATVDDAVAAADRRAHDVYSQIVKKLVANPALNYRRMYANPVLMPFFGRIIVTLNDDANSIAMLPSTDGSIMDKLMFLKASDPKVSFDGAEATIARELPHYLAFLRDYKIPEWMQGDARFGVREYKNPDLLISARDNSASAHFRDILDMWETQYTRAVPDAKFWQGTASELLVELRTTASVETLLRGSFQTPAHVGRMLNGMEIAGTRVVGVRTADRREYRITFKKPSA